MIDFPEVGDREQKKKKPLKVACKKMIKKIMVL